MQELISTFGLYEYKVTRNDGKDIPESATDSIEADCDERVISMSKEGCREGEILSYVVIDGEEVEYSGWFYPSARKDLHIYRENEIKFYDRIAKYEKNIEALKKKVKLGEAVRILEASLMREKRLILELSTTHVEELDMKLLDGDKITAIASYPEGAFVNVVQDDEVLESLEEIGYSKAFITLYANCIEIGVTTMRLDSDCKVIDGLPKKEW